MAGVSEPCTQLLCVCHGIEVFRREDQAALLLLCSLLKLAISSAAETVVLRSYHQSPYAIDRQLRGGSVWRIVVFAFAVLNQHSELVTAVSMEAWS